MEVKAKRNRPIAVFMAFGTKGDVYAIAAISVAFACDQRKYEVVFVSHSAHQDLATHLIESNCVVAAPYVINYTAPSSFQRKFRLELPLLYQYLQEDPDGKLGWRDVIHWIWPLFSEDWCPWRRDELNLSPFPFTEPVTGNPMWLERPFCPLVWYGFSIEVVECPGYWPSKSHVCGFWFLLSSWQFSCRSYRDTFISRGELCSIHTAGFEPLDVAVQVIAAEGDSSSSCQSISLDNWVSLCKNRLYCFSGSLPYSWLFPKCVTVIHHGGSGSTAAALRARIPQVICLFILDQFYWAEGMCWLGVALELLRRNHLLPENYNDISIREGPDILIRNVLNHAMSPELKARGLKISWMISREDGLSEAVRILKTVQ